MAIYAIADLHLSKDPTVQKPMDRFGEIWKNHDEKIRKNWIDKVSENDTVIIAGDISWGLKLSEAVFDLDWVDDLPGKKVCIKGNHDLWWSGITKLNSMYESITFLQNKSYDAGDCYICGSRGWDCPGHIGYDEQDEKIYKREVLRLSYSLEDAAKQMKKNREIKDIIGVLHYPPTNERFHKSGFTELFEKYGVKRVVYGHLHKKEGFKKGYKGEMNGIKYDLISVDYLNFDPIRLY